MDIETARDERSTNLIADFTDGYALGWRFAVRDVFRSALDIKWTPRIYTSDEVDENGKKRKIIEYLWTQGKYFNFTQGDVIYDTRIAYKLKWSDALQHIKLFVQVAESSPTQLVTNSTINTLTAQGNESPNDDLILQKVQIRSGKVKFKLFRPNSDRSNVDELEKIDCDQKNFVTFLQTGIITTLDNKTRDLFHEEEARGRTFCFCTSR